MLQLKRSEHAAFLGCVLVILALQKSILVLEDISLGLKKKVVILYM